MGSDIEQGKGAATAVVDPPPAKQRGCMPACSRALNFVTGIASLLCIVAFGLAIALGPHERDLQGFIQQSLRVYGMVVGLLILLTETEWEKWLAQVRVLESWLGRGVLMLFEALLTLEITSTVKAGETDFHRSLQLYRLPAAISLLACAGLYILGGMLCLGRRKRVLKQRAVERLKVQSTLVDLERKRAELQGLLAVYSNE